MDAVAFRLLIALLLLGTCGPVSAAPGSGTSVAAGQEEEEDTPTPAPLTVGSMAIASQEGLTVEAMAVDVAIDHVSYSYRLRNKGPSKLSLAASVALPDLEVNSEGATIYNLPTQNAANFIDLAVKADDKPVETKLYQQAIALGIDRLADLKAENMPLIPFGDAIDKALSSAKPETLTKLEGLGLVTPRDPAQPDTPAIADWSLHSIIGWTQTIEPNAATNINVGFTPVKAVYMVEAAALSGFDALKEQVCLTPQIMAAANGLLKGKGSQAEVVDITLANDGPARWLDNPPGTVGIRKPTPSSVVAFCGMDAGTAGQPVVKGKMPGGNDAAGLRVLIFTSASAK